MCDTMAALAGATTTGGVLFGKNSDRERNEAQYLQLLPAQDYGKGAVVRTLALTRLPVSVWLVGQYLSGDNPANLVATVQTLAARNVLYCPGGIGTPTLEVLEPA